MRKLGILTHSFDANWMPKVKIPQNVYNMYNNEYINSHDNENYIDYNNIVNKPNNNKGSKIEIQGSVGTTGAVSQQILNQPSNININYDN